MAGEGNPALMPCNTGRSSAKSVCAEYMSSSIELCNLNGDIENLLVRKNQKVKVRNNWQTAMLKIRNVCAYGLKACVAICAKTAKAILHKRFQMATHTNTNKTMAN